MERVFLAIASMSLYYISYEEQARDILHSATRFVGDICGVREFIEPIEPIANRPEAWFIAVEIIVKSDFYSTEGSGTCIIL